MDWKRAHWMRSRERRKARRGGYFWITCERCGQGFGGHEIGGENGTIINKVFEYGRCWEGTTTCANCPGNYVRHPELGVITIGNALHIYHRPTMGMLLFHATWIALSGDESKLTQPEDWQKP